MKNKTLPELDALEASLSSKLETIKSKLKKAEARYVEVLLNIDESPDSKSAKKELEEIQIQRRTLAEEVESIEALLRTMPARRKHARADEIEEEIKSFQLLKDRLIAIAPNLDAAAEAFVLAKKEYYLILCEIKKKGGYALDSFYPDVNAEYSLPFFMKKHGLLKHSQHNNPKSQVESMDDSTGIGVLLDRLFFNMRESIKQLRGEKINNVMGHCPRCYSPGRYATPTSEKVICSKCGTTIR